MPPDLKRKKGCPRKKRIEQFRQGLQDKFGAKDIVSQNASQQAVEAAESREDSSEAEGRIECWDGEMGDMRALPLRIRQRRMGTQFWVATAQRGSASVLLNTPGNGCLSQ